MKQRRLWIVIADGEHARFVSAAPKQAFRSNRFLEKEQGSFAREVAQEIDRAAAVAPAHTLREIRDQLDPTTLAKMVGALQKDLTKVPDHELAGHLDGWA